MPDPMAPRPSACDVIEQEALTIEQLRIEIFEQRQHHARLDARGKKAPRKRQTVERAGRRASAFGGGRMGGRI